MERTVQIFCTVQTIDKLANFESFFTVRVPIEV